MGAPPGCDAQAMALLDDVIIGAVAAEGGVVIEPRGEGDSHFAVFERPSAALRAALGLQAGVQREVTPTVPLRVRAAVSWPVSRAGTGR